MYRNPVLYGDFSDPDVVRVGDDFYMVASSFTYLPGVPLLHSKDLVHWEIINHCVSRLPFEKYDRPSHGSGTWAPSIRFHEGMFYVFVPLVDEGILYKKRGIGMFVAQGAKQAIKNKRKDAFYENFVKSLLTEAARLGIGEEELIKMIRQHGQQES